MSQDSGGEPLPPGRRAASRAPGPLRQAQPPSAATNPGRPVPEEFPPGGHWPDAHVPDAAIPDPLIPDALPVLPRLRLSVRRDAAAQRDAAGDWLDVLVLPDGSTALVIGQVERYGGRPGPVRAGAARLRAGLRDALRGRAAPVEALASLGAVASGPAPGRGAAVCVAVLDPLTGNLHYATAGLPVPVICAAAGAAAGPAGQPDAGTAILPSGAVLLLYSGPARVQDGAARSVVTRSVAARAASVLAGSGSATAADPADRVVPAVLAGLSGDGGSGPATVLAAHRLLAPVAGWAVNLPADPLALRELRRRLRDWLRDLGVSLSDRTDVELAVWEAAVNAIVHGRPVAGRATVTVRAGLDIAGRAEIQVSDRGQWRPPDPGRRWPGGQGLMVIRQATDELDIAPGPQGTTVTLRRRLSRPAAGQAEPGE
ncbi:MAG: ATP-binding protein [Streptosporangiaceae bacterium]